tara:strand:- start:396 stop:572 length:177 start_codon:yes stop_codon:yes gene_type:complete
MPEIDFGAMNIDDNPNIATSLGVKGIPFVILVVNSEVKATRVGLTAKDQFKAWLKENI